MTSSIWRIRLPLWRQVVLGISVWLVGCSMVAGIAVSASYQQRNDRMLFRTPVPAGTVAEATFLWAGTNNYCRDRPVDVHRVRRLVDSAPLPPGVARWPAPGEVVVSPELLERGCGDGLGTRVGLIDPAALSDPGELVVYSNPVADVEVDARFEPMAGWAGGDGQEHVIRESAVPLGSPMYDQSERRFLVVWAVMVLLPSLTVFAAAVGLYRQKIGDRDRVYAAMGMGSGRRLWLRTSPMTAPAIVGAASSWLAVVLVAQREVIKIPVSEFHFSGGDLWSRVGWISVFHVLVAVGCALVGGMITGWGWVPGRRPGRGVAWVRTAFAGVAALLWVMVIVASLGAGRLATAAGPDLFSAVLMGLIIGAALLTPAVVGLCTSWSMAANSQLLRRSTSPSHLAGAGLLRFSAGDIRAFGAVVGVLMIFVTLLTSLYSAFTSPAPDVVEFHDRYRGHVAVVERLPLTADGRDRFEAILAERQLDYVVVAARTLDAEFTVYDPRQRSELTAEFSEEVGRCTFSGSPAAVADLLSVYWHIDEAECVVEKQSQDIASHAVRGNTNYVVYSADGATDPKAIQRDLDMEFAVPPLVESPGQGFIIGEAVNADQGRWLLLVTLSLAVQGLTAAWLFAAGNLSECIRRILPFTFMGASWRFIWASLGIRFLTPALIGFIWGSLGGITIIWAFRSIATDVPSASAVLALVMTSICLLIVTVLAWVVVTTVSVIHVGRHVRYNPEEKHDPARS